MTSQCRPSGPWCSRTAAANSSRACRMSSRIRSKSTAPSSHLGRPTRRRRGEEDRPQEDHHGDTLVGDLPRHAAAGEGYEVYAVTDASGGVSAEAHDMAMHRMAMTGVVPITWMAVAGELQRDWAREETAKKGGEMFLEHGGATGIALAWELQLLSQKAGGGA
jgi:hypothetical protein